MVASAKTDKFKPPVFHQNELVRGWRILRQHNKIHVDLDRRAIWGTASFDFSALNYHFVNLALNLRRCRVKSCRVNGQSAPFRHVSPLDDEDLLRELSSEKSRHRIKDIEHSMRLRDDAAVAQGELVVDLPASVSADIIDDLNDAFAQAKRNGAAEDNADPNAPPYVPLDQLPLLNLCLEYEVLDPSAGALYFGDRNARNPVIDPVYMLTESRYGMARFWMPCIESTQWCDRYLFDFDIAVAAELTVVASGELLGTVLYSPEDNIMSDSDLKDPVKVYKYRLHAPSHASEIVLAVGPFIALPDPVLSNTVTHFCFPGRAKELVHTCPTLFAKALAFCRDYFGADPPTSSFKHLFVGSEGRRLENTVVGAGGVVVYSGNLLHTARAIDEGFAAREAIMSGMVQSYFGRFLRPRLGEDDWLIMGLASHVTALGLQAILGRNWYRFKVLDVIDELRKEKSVALSDTHVDRVSDMTLDAVKRRSHLIVYMIERRIGSDVLRRALRDIVAEGRSVTIALVKLLETAVSKSGNCTSGLANGDGNRCFPMYARVLSDLNGMSREHGGVSSVVSTGFDEAQQGVSVGPFLKRLRAICGTDLRSMVRHWASSPGVPRWQIGYQYNPRKHALEFVLKQEGVLKGSEFSGRRGLFFTGSLHIRVMEIEGASDHTIEVRDPIFIGDLPCHSRRAKHKSAAQAEKEFNENPARASPVLWVRVDPDTEVCKDVIFRQGEDSWTALLKGERDAVGQFEACRGLSAFANEMSAKALLILLEDEQLYWRVRAEAANVLAKCESGLDMLLNYFRSCYSDKNTTNLGLVRPNNFSCLANYYVKRAMIKAVASARVKNSRTQLLPEGSIPVEAAQFLSWVLSTNDNAANEFEDHHYVVDLVNTCGKVAVFCLEDPRHESAGDDGISTTESIANQFERYQSIEQLLPTSSRMVSAAIAKALSDIELAKMALQNKNNHGDLLRSILMGTYQCNRQLLRSIYVLSNRECTHDTRLTALTCLTKAYAGNLEIALWIIARCDRHSSDGDLLEIYSARRDRKESLSQWGFIESPVLRYKLLDALSDAAACKHWGEVSPLMQALRRHTKRAMEFCIRVLRLCVGDSEPRVRSSALRLAKIIWGVGVPVCLLSRTEYIEIKRELTDGKRGHMGYITTKTPEASGVKCGAKDIVPVKSNAGVTLPQITQVMKPLKPLKPTKSSKGGKSSKSSKRRLATPNSGNDGFFSRDNSSSGGPATNPVGVIDLDDYAVDNAKLPGREKNLPKPRAAVRPVSPIIREPIGVSPVEFEQPRKSEVPFRAGISASMPRSAPRITSKLAPPSLSPEPPINAPKLTPISIPRSIPKSVPKSIPKSVPKSVPKSLPKGIPKSVPKSVLKGIPKSVPRVIPKSVPKSVPKSAPSVDAPDTELPINDALKSSVPVLPKAVVPKSIPRSIPKAVPKSVAVPKSIPRSVPRSIPKSVPRRIPKSVPRSAPRDASLSIPKSVPAREPLASVPFVWHPLDQEDFKFLKREWKTKVAEKERRRHDSRANESVQRRGGAESAPRGTEDHQANSGDGEIKKKKKKKKKKRTLEDGEESHKKRKKRKKYREEGDGFLEREPNFDDEFAGANGVREKSARGSSSNGPIGKLKFKRSSIVPVEKN